MSAALGGRAARRLVALGCLVSVACAGDSANPSVAAAPAAVPAAAVAASAPQVVASPPALEAEAADAVEKVLTAAQHPGLTWSSIGDVTAALRTLYDAEPDRLLWFDGPKPLPVVERTLMTLAAAGDHGLDPADYDVASMAAHWTDLKGGAGSAADRALFDVGLSVAAARILHAAHNGRVDPATMHWGYAIDRKPVDAAALLREAREGRGLEADGVIGAGTIKALNVSQSQRVRQVELAMERMRWLPQLGDRPNVFVNVPLFRLWATDPAGGEEPLRMNVVVGQSLNHKTPLFIEQMEYVIFRPYWNPPRGITVKEIIPHQRRDASYFDREQLEIVASGNDNAKALPPTPENLSAVVAGKLFIRQKPGPKNSLGLAKFIFPNSDNVYMHGTPAQQLFSRPRRDFSHGCVRLEDPARFGEWVLRDYPEWTRERIDQAMQGERPTRVNLKQPLTVVLFYDTVHVNSEGVVFFVDDIYGHDRALDAALANGYPYPVKG